MRRPTKEVAARRERSGERANGAARPRCDEGAAEFTIVKYR